MPVASAEVSYHVPDALRPGGNLAISRWEASFVVERFPQHRLRRGTPGWCQSRFSASARCRWPFRWRQVRRAHGCQYWKANWVLHACRRPLEPLFRLVFQEGRVGSRLGILCRPAARRCGAGFPATARASGPGHRRKRCGCERRQLPGSPWPLGVGAPGVVVRVVVPPPPEATITPWVWPGSVLVTPLTVCV